MATRNGTSSIRGSPSSGQLRRIIGLRLLLSIVGSSLAQFAIPERYDGFVYNGGPEQGRGLDVWEVSSKCVLRGQGAAHCADDEHFTRVSSLGAHDRELGELGFSTNTIEAGFNDAVTDQATRISFKYGCSRGVVGTPTYLVNGVAVVGANAGWSVDDWAKNFDRMATAPGCGMAYHTPHS